MEFLLAQIINGLILGGIYALLVTGFNLLLLEGGIFQYAYPHLLVLSMYVSWLVLRVTGNNLFLGILAAVLSGVVLGIATEPIFRTLSKRGAAVASFIVALGIAIIITDILSRVINKGIQISFPESRKGEKALLQFGYAIISAGQMLTIVGSFVAVGGIFFFLFKTKTGRAMRAMAQVPGVARLMGLPVNVMSLYSYILAGILGGISSVFLIMALGSASSGLGNTLALKVLAVAIFAGLGNLGGGLVSALILGMAESFVMGYLRGDWANAVAFGMIMLIVMVKPHGIFGMKA
jgi:branched-subunit amino acid ABC-type transport system permease component